VLGSSTEGGRKRDQKKDGVPMVVLRFLGRLFIVLALVILVAGLAVWLLGIDVTQIAGQAWRDADVSSLNLAQVVVQRYLRIPALWDSVIVPQLLLRPLWEATIVLFVLFLVLGGLLLRLGRPPRRRGRFG